MSLIFVCDNPTSLLQAIRDGIDEGDIDTWEYDEDGAFTHTADQWEYEAWLMPVISNGKLVFGIVPPEDEDITGIAYAIYHGRFIQMMLYHFDKKFTTVKATAFLEKPDVWE